MSMASGGAFTRTIFWRIAATAPVISSTLSPRTRSAIRNPPICEGVTSPDSIESKAADASARVSVAPVATLAIRGLKDSMGPASLMRPSRMKSGGQLQEIAQDLAPVLTGDAFRVELHAIHRTLVVGDRHDEAVVGIGGDFEFSRDGRALDHER